jgi:hypothetical protein
VRAVSGSVVPPKNADLDLATLEVVSLAERARIDESGRFKVLVPETDHPQILFVAGTENVPIMMGLVGAADVDGVVIGASSTAAALVLANPFLTMCPADEREIVAQAALGAAEWTTLTEHAVDAIEESGSLDPGVDPGLWQLAAEVVIDVLDGFIAGPAQYADPWTEDMAGDGVALANPHPVYYTASVSEVGGENTIETLVESERADVTVSLGWPPLVLMSEATRTEVMLGDGTFDIVATRGEFLSYDAATSEGLAATANAGRGILEIIALGSGMVPDLDPADLDLTAAPAAGALGPAVRSGDPYRVVGSFLDLAEAETARVASWIWDGQNEDCEDYIDMLCAVVAGCTFATEVVAGGVETIPYFSRLVSPGTLDSHRISQLDGVMIYAGDHSPPSAEFVVEPSFVEPGEPVFFDPSPTIDPDDDSADLLMRWDWENDGVWDTEWLSAVSPEHAFSTPGVHEVALQVRDPRMLNDTVVRDVNVGGGEASAAHIVILRDVVPWSPEVPPVLDQMLEIMDLTEGPGPGQYEVAGSEQLRGLDLTPGEDLVIVQSDQTQGFYDACGDNQVLLLQFVRDGGTIFWEACDLGWHGGSIEQAGIVLPGSVDLQPHETWFNYVELPGAPLVQGLPSTLYGEFASHARIDNLPDGATVYAVDDEHGPTLVEFGYGEGWVIMTTQPLEWTFYNNWTCGAVMPHVVCYVLGLPLVHDFGDIVKPDERGRPPKTGGARYLTSGMR